MTVHALLNSLEKLGSISAGNKNAKLLTRDNVTLGVGISYEINF